MWWWYQISSWTENKSSRNGKQSKILCYTSWELNKTQIRKTSSHLIKNFRCGVKWQHLYYRICHTKKNWQFKKEMHIIRLYEESANQFLCNTSWQYKQVTISIAQYYVNKDAIEMLRWLLAWSRNQTILHNPKSEFNHHPFNKNIAYVGQGIKIHFFKFELKIQIHYTLFIHHHHAHLSLTSIYLIHINMKCTHKYCIACLQINIHFKL